MSLIPYNPTLVRSPPIEIIKQDSSGESDVSEALSETSQDTDSSIDRLIDISLLCSRINSIFVSIDNDIERLQVRSFIETKLSDTIGTYTKHYRKATPLQPGNRPSQ